MIWSRRIVNKMTQVKRVAARPASSRKQQRYSLMKAFGSLALICCSVVFLLQSDPFPGVRRAALRHRSQSETQLDNTRDVGRDLKKNGEGNIVTGEIKETKKEKGEADETTNGGRSYTIELSNLTDGKKGEIVIETKPEWAPLGVEQLHKLLDDNFYQDAKIFRVVNDFMVQFGIPAIPSKKYKKAIKDDKVLHTNARGTISFAMAGKNTRTTQLFINTREKGNKYLDGQGFAPIGVVTKGMELVDQIFSGYGEAPNQGMIQNRGNKYLDKEFPLLSYISKTTQV